MGTFLKKLEMNNSTFDHVKVESKDMLSCNYLLFPSAAAGMYTTTHDFLKFSASVIDAWNGRASPISRATAKIMLTPAMNQRDFIGLDPGHGFFVIENEDNSITFAHQGANENFRIIIIANTAGPASYVVANSDYATPLNCEITRGLMQDLGFPGALQASLPSISKNVKRLSCLEGVYSFLCDKNGEKVSRDVSISLNKEEQLVRSYNDQNCLLHPISDELSTFMHSSTGKPYKFDKEGKTLTITDVNNCTVNGHKLEQFTDAQNFDDREYNIDDPAKLVNLHFRDLLDLDGTLLK